MCFLEGDLALPRSIQLLSYSSDLFLSTRIARTAITITFAELCHQKLSGENKDLFDGIGSAGGSLARGISDGVSGLIKNPIKGAERGGLSGFAKGFGTGMLGLVVKPVVGVTDAATDVLQGVSGCFPLRVDFTSAFLASSCLRNG